MAVEEELFLLLRSEAQGSSCRRVNLEKQTERVFGRGKKKKQKTTIVKLLWLKGKGSCESEALK